MQEGEILKLVIDHKAVQIPDTLGLEVKIIRSGSCLFGIRPEDIHLKRENTGMSFQVRIDSIEPLGRENLHFFSLGEQKMSALVMSDTDLREGDTVNVEFDFHKAHFFSK